LLFLLVFGFRDGIEGWVLATIHIRGFPLELIHRFLIKSGACLVRSLGKNIFWKDIFAFMPSIFNEKRRKWDET